MDDKQELAELRLEVEKTNRRLDEMERQLQDQDHHKYSRGGSIWALIPIAAIVMWGLTHIMN